MFGIGRPLLRSSNAITTLTTSKFTPTTSSFLLRNLTTNSTNKASHSPSTGPLNPPSPAPHSTTAPQLDNSIITGGGKAGLTNQWDVNNQVYPDYSKGPSALDKASRLFFFTEILRGRPFYSNLQ